MKLIPLHGIKADGRSALVDDEDFDLVMQYRWFVHEDTAPDRTPSGPYARAQRWERNRAHPVYMHKLITGFNLTDHVNHDTLDNRRSNLRRATGSQNSANSRPRKGCSSRFKGVSWEKYTGRWVAYITVQQKRVNLGRFALERDAALAYNKAALEAWGEFALLNDIGVADVSLD